MVGDVDATEKLVVTGNTVQRNTGWYEVQGRCLRVVILQIEHGMPGLETGIHDRREQHAVSRVDLFWIVEHAEAVETFRGKILAELGEERLALAFEQCAEVAASG